MTLQINVNEQNYLSKIVASNINANGFYRISLMYNFTNYRFEVLQISITLYPKLRNIANISSLMRRNTATDSILTVDTNMPPNTYLYLQLINVINVSYHQL